MGLKVKDLSGFEYRRYSMKKGKKYEGRIQRKIEESSEGQIYNNVQVGNICEFDVIVADYPLLTFVEIKAYRLNMKKKPLLANIRKLKRDCVEVTTDPYQWNRSWTPCLSKVTTNGVASNLEVLFNKLELGFTEGWKYRLCLIVPDRVYKLTLSHLHPTYPPLKSIPSNVVSIDDLPLVVIKEKNIKNAF